MKLLYLAPLFFILYIVRANAQPPFIHTVGNTQYILSGGKWHALDPHDNSLWPIDSTVSIRFVSGTGTAVIASFVQQFQLVLKSSHPSGQNCYRLTNLGDFFLRCDSIWQSPLVSVFSVGTIGRAHLVPNDWVIMGGLTTLPPAGYSAAMHQRLGTFDAWNITTGQLTHPIAAVIDLGVDYTHSDIGIDSGTTDNLYQNIYTNTAEDDWTNKNDPNSGNNVDNDNNWYVDDYKGVNVAMATNNSREMPFQPAFWTSMFNGHGRLWTHGTAMAGILGAKTNNAANGQNTNPLLARYQMAGIAGGNAAQGVRMLPISVYDNLSMTALVTTAGGPAVHYARREGAVVANISLGGLETPFMNQALDSAYIMGMVVVASTGNVNVGTVDYPARWPSVIAVGGSDANDHRVGHGVIGGAGAQYGPELDLVAPYHENNWILTPLDTIFHYTPGIGTSGAAAMVSGTVVLMKDINPCLSPDQVDEVLKNTATKAHSVTTYNYYTNAARPGWNIEMGYGRLHIGDAVKAAQAMYKTTVDLHIKDRATDFGVEPATTYTAAWESPDIWIRRQPDGLQNTMHQNPQYKFNASGQQIPMYMYVRVRNKSCANYTGSSQKLIGYWSGAATNQTWPLSFHDPTPGPTPTGRPIDSIIIPPIPAGQDTILRFTWYPPNPALYPQSLGSQKHFCLVARITGSPDPVATELTGVGANQYVLQNNNVALRNVIFLTPTIAYTATFKAGIPPLTSPRRKARALRSLSACPMAIRMWWPPTQPSTSRSTRPAGRFGRRAAERGSDLWCAPKPSDRFASRTRRKRRCAASAFRLVSKR